MKTIKNISIGKDVTFEIWEAYKEESILSLENFNSSLQFDLVYEGYTKNIASFPLQAGDMIVTSSSKTGALGLTGHAGIAISTNSILHYAGNSETAVSFSTVDS